MSYFTNDVDTVSDALNNSFAMVIQSFIQIVGTLAMLFVLNWQLSLLVVVGYAAMFLYIRYSGRRSRAYFTRQQASLGELDGYIEEMVSGQKVVKVFNHEAENQRVFREKNDALRRAGTGAQSYAATMVPAVVTISYINYALVAVLGGIMALRGMTDIGSLASYLVFVRGRRRCPSTSSPSKATCFWPRWPVPSAFSAPWRSSRRRTRAPCAL